VLPIGGDSAIARHVGVNAQTVANWREKMASSSEIRKMETRTVIRNGTIYQQDVSNIGRKPAPRIENPNAARDWSYLGKFPR
jgi:hypothetical protein